MHFQKTIVMEIRKSSTLDYYEQHADAFIETSINADMSSIYSRFLPYIPHQGSILDAGCGSGRDTLHFLKKGYYVEAFDGSSELANKSSKLSGMIVQNCCFETFDSKTTFDGIWASASLLHIHVKDLSRTIERLLIYLKSTGVFYLSFKYGNESRSEDGRFFQDMNERTLQVILTGLDANVRESWVSEDVRPGRSTKWLNVFLEKKNLSK